ncbi:MAG: DUF4212 domain-containing protein [Bacteroidales bacterium]|nr:DUF4212 domain-containing protein [Bacteroidales bacterium]
MEPSDQYDFSIFRPRNLHGRKNRNVIFTMLLIWAVAVFGFQILLRSIQKPTPEKALTLFESTWPKVLSDDINSADYRTFLNSLVQVKGKNMVSAADQETLKDIISTAAFRIMPDSTETLLLDGISEVKALKVQLGVSKDNEFLKIKTKIQTRLKELTHNQSALTDTVFLGFPFHYFYTAVFLLILFIVLCIVYNILVEWRLKKEGVTE